MANYTKPQIIPFAASGLNEIGYTLKEDGQPAQSRVSLTVGEDGVEEVGDGFYQIPAIVDASFEGRVSFDSTETPNAEKIHDRVIPDSSVVNPNKKVIYSACVVSTTGVIAQNATVTISSNTMSPYSEKVGADGIVRFELTSGVYTVDVEDNELGTVTKVVHLGQNYYDVLVVGG